MSADVDRYAAEREFSEPGDTATRERLGLRPTYYEDDDSKHEHPDHRPCPPWCWIVTDNPDEYTHDVDPVRPMLAVHTMEPVPHLVASCYGGRQEPSGVVRTATFELRAEQMGIAAPVIKLFLRDWDKHTKEARFEECCALTVTDALEMIVALRDVVDRLGGCEPDKERNAFELGRDYERMKSQDN